MSRNFPVANTLESFLTHLLHVFRLKGLQNRLNPDDNDRTSARFKGRRSMGPVRWSPLERTRSRSVGANSRGPLLSQPRTARHIVAVGERRRAWCQDFGVPPKLMVSLLGACRSRRSSHYRLVR
jgi:hypothetical protein